MNAPLDDPFPQAPAPAARPRRAGLVVAACAAVIAVLIGALYVVSRQDQGPSGPVTVGNCVDVRSGPGPADKIFAAQRVACASGKAAVTKVLSSGKRTAFPAYGARSAPDCPPGTDGLARVTGTGKDERYWEVCIRNTAAPHPGDPGAGGGLLDAGDCVADFMLAGEKACGDDGWYGKVIARVDTVAACPARKTLEIARLQSFGGGAPARPVLCYGPGGKVLAPGDCIADPTYAINGIGKRPCASKEAVARITARVRTRKECPAGSNRYLKSKDDGAYLPVTCLKRLRPTLNDRLRSR
ncbi:hypothetical protein [Actinomadura macrotermitis]|uniref:Uncharacterized protein n=1 Tax=Actinomadura macrotermitis TaxID=2585200 RepID=A0A7K0BSA0_9ACTN|nr:hypothetical protein [Actinomadura macrotermitis]MQY04049.1 hypothetical protein [Actinomadura macrotermitis]